MGFPLGGDSYEEVIERMTALYGKPTDKLYADGETIIDMIEILPDTPEHYTCNRFDRSTGSCTRYDERPDMCRRYPYDRSCKYCGMTNLLMLNP
jgi:Fe-S-cluster containining protein